MGDHDDGGAGGVEFGEHFHDGVAVGGVEIAGGFVGQEYGWIAGQSAGDGDALLLAAGELSGIVRAAMRDLDAFEHVGDAGFAFGRVDAAIRQGSSTFSATVRSPIRLKFWKMKPISRLRIAISGR